MSEEKIKADARIDDRIRMGDRIRATGDWGILIETWRSLMDRYVDVMRDLDDLPYWYNERANVGFLAAAAWHLGGVSIWEYSVKAMSDIKAATRFPDLWIRIPQLKLNCEIQAKIVWGGNALLDQAYRGIAAAADDLRKLPSDHTRAPIGVALCFACPMVRSSSEGSNILKEFITRFETMSERDSYLAAAYEPQVGAPVEYEGYYYPGVVLMGRVVWDTRQA